MSNKPSQIDNRCLPLSGAVNFRDIGGNRGKNLKLVKTGLVYRSDHLSRLSEDDQQLLESLGFKTVCDLRSVKEQEKSPDLLPKNNAIQLLSLPIQSKNFDPATAIARLKAGDDSWLTMEYLVDLYIDYLDNFGEVFGKIFMLIASPVNLPLVFHCTGGKDRTGIMAALLLKFLGVEEEKIFFDHDLSNACNKERLKPIYEKFADLGVGPDKAFFYLQAPLEPLIELFSHLNKRYGSVEEYLLTRGKVDRSLLRSIEMLLLQ